MTDTSRRAFRSLGSRELSRWVLTCEHASNRLPFPRPPDRELRRILASHWGWDIGALALTRELTKRLRAAAVTGVWSRLFIDLNRPVIDSTLLREEAGGIVVPWNRDLSAAAVERRVLDYHVPFHAEIDRVILRHLVRDMRPILIAIHTFTPQLESHRRPFDVGVLFSDHARQAYRVGSALRAAGLRVRYNEPYSGLLGMMYSVDRHGSHHGLTHLELELNQALFDDPRNVTRLARVTARALQALST
jgi:predicted N-formylglutamate amidohydrolase